MKKFIDILFHIERVASILLFSMLIFVSRLQIFSRLFGNPISWTEEFLRFGFVWLIFVTSTVVTNEQTHFKIDILYDRLGEKIQRILEIGLNICILIFCGIQMYYGWILTVVGCERISPTLRIPMNYVYVIIPITGLISGIHIIYRISKKRKEK